MPKNCATSAGIVAAIANPPGIPATKDATEDWLVRTKISFAAAFSIRSWGIPALTGPISMMVCTSISSPAKVSARNLLRLTFTPGILTALVIIVSSATEVVSFLACSIILILSIKLVILRCFPMR